MSYDYFKSIDLQSAFSLAEQTARLKSPKAKFILDHTVEKHKRGYLNLSFAYLRWVDDFVDNPNIAVSDKEKLVNRQKFLIQQYAKKHFEEYKLPEEAFLYHFIEYANKVNAQILINAAKKMVEAIGMDVDRLKGDGIFSEAELNFYINTLSKALYDIIIYFFLPGQYQSVQNVLTGRFQARAFMMRDIIEDIDAGFINIPREDINKFKLDINSIKEKRNLEHWLEKEIDHILKLLIDEAEEANLLPTKFKIFMYYSHLYYLPKIFRLKEYSFNPLLAAQQKKITNELKAYLHSAAFGVKLFKIEFLKP
ncbi:MAG: hypothetical protein HXY50_13380 [Ignavibacteriaceae bacterium]|nr:hypothetical protein [Ignavibacteriaceae bacterium]